MFYVVYYAKTKQYMNDKGQLGPYTEAAQFRDYQDAMWDLADPTGFRVVGPCREGEEP